MKLFKRILIFIQLKFDETIGFMWRFDKVATITSTISFVSTIYVFKNEPEPRFLKLIASLMMAFIGYFIIVGIKEFFPLFIKWIKDNWEEAGKRVGK